MADKRNMLLEEKQVRRFAKLSGVTLNEDYMKSLSEAEDKKEEEFPPTDEEMPTAPEEGGDDLPDMGDELGPEGAEGDEMGTEELPPTSDVAEVPMDPDQVKSLVSAITTAIQDVTGVELGVEGEAEGGDIGTGEIEPPAIDGTPEHEGEETPEEEKEEHATGEELPDEEEETLEEMLNEAIKRAVKDGKKEVANNLKQLQRKMVSEKKVVPAAKKIQLSEEMTRRVVQRVVQRVLKEQKVQSAKK